MAILVGEFKQLFNDVCLKIDLISILIKSVLQSKAPNATTSQTAGEVAYLLGFFWVSFCAESMAPSSGCISQQPHLRSHTITSGRFLLTLKMLFYYDGSNIDRIRIIHGLFNFRKDVNASLGGIWHSLLNQVRNIILSSQNDFVLQCQYKYCLYILDVGL